MFDCTFILGGLASVIYTDTLQSVVLVISATILAILGKCYIQVETTTSYVSFLDIYLKSDTNDQLYNRLYVTTVSFSRTDSETFSVFLTISTTVRSGKCLIFKNYLIIV